jgi:hypothetical protein
MRGPARCLNATGNAPSSSTFPARPPHAIVTHPRDDVADQHLAMYQVCLGDHPLLAAAVAHNPQEPRRERAQRLVEGFLSGRQRVVPVAPPVPSGDHRHQEVPGGRIMRAKKAFTSGEASVFWSASSLRRMLSRLLVTVTIAGPVIAAALAFFLGGRFGRWA